MHYIKHNLCIKTYTSILHGHTCYVLYVVGGDLKVVREHINVDVLCRIYAHYLYSYIKKDIYLMQMGA